MMLNNVHKVYFQNNKSFRKCVRRKRITLSFIHRYTTNINKWYEELSRAAKRSRICSAQMCDVRQNRAYTEITTNIKRHDCVVLRLLLFCCGCCSFAEWVCGYKHKFQQHETFVRLVRTRHVYQVNC